MVERQICAGAAPDAALCAVGAAFEGMSVSMPMLTAWRSSQALLESGVAPRHGAWRTKRDNGGSGLYGSAHYGVRGPSSVSESAVPLIALTAGAVRRGQPLRLRGAGREYVPSEEETSEDDWSSEDAEFFETDEWCVEQCLRASWMARREMLDELGYLGDVSCGNYHALRRVCAALDGVLDGTADVEQRQALAARLEPWCAYFAEPESSAEADDVFWFRAVLRQRIGLD
jgi:hypothetical protein